MRDLDDVVPVIFQLLSVEIQFFDEVAASICVEAMKILLNQPGKLQNIRIGHKGF